MNNPCSYISRFWLLDYLLHLNVAIVLIFGEDKFVQLLDPLI